MDLRVNEIATIFIKVIEYSFGGFLIAFAKKLFPEVIVKEVIDGCDILDNLPTFSEVHGTQT